MKSHPLVYLLRDTEEDDPFEAAFIEAGFAVRSVPVLSFRFVNEARLGEALAHPDNYGGLIVTSPRAVDALTNALCWLPAQAAPWEARPAYVVGPRTAEAMWQIGFEPTGEDSGTGEALAEVIVAGDFEAPLLFLSGNRRREALPARLHADGVLFDEIVVYETHLRTDFDFSDLPSPDWLVFFSPSGVEAFGAMRSFQEIEMKKAALGPTTAEALEAAGWPPDAVAAAPTPEALVAAVGKV